MDIYCQNCGEPWDHAHILDTIPGIRSGAETDDALHSGVLDTEGQWWRFEFLYRNMLYEANYLIALCPACEPDIGQPDCKDCYGHGRVSISRATQAQNHKCRQWFYGCHPNVKNHPSRPFRNGKSFKHDYEGMIYRGWAYCPSCFPSQKEYWEAAKAAGWTEPQRMHAGALREIANSD